VKYFHVTLKEASMGFESEEESANALKLSLQGLPSFKHSY